MCSEYFCHLAITNNFNIILYYSSLKPIQWENMLNDYRRSPAAQTFLSSYEYDDVGIVQLSNHSTSIWTISPPDNQTLIDDVVNGSELFKCS